MSIIIKNHSITIYNDGLSKTLNSTGSNSIQLTPYGLFYSNSSVSDPQSKSISIKASSIERSIILNDNGNQTLLLPNGTINNVISISGNTISGIVPQGPTGLQAIATASAAGSTGTVSLSFTAPPNSGTPITSYNVVPNPTAPITSTANIPAPPITVSNLTNGQPYTFTLSANNASGTGIAVTSNSVTPYAYPNAPQGVSGYFSDDQHADKQCMVAFTKPVINGLDNGPNQITSYNVYQNGSLIGSLPNNVYGTGITGLTNGTSYSFGVSAVNTAGTGYCATTSAIIPFTIPNAPVINSITDITSSSAVISFSAPSNTNDYLGAPITRYDVMAGATGYTTVLNSGLTTSLSLSTLKSNTEYSIALSATNKAGTSIPATSTLTTYPLAPTGINAIHTGVSGQINVFWANHPENGPLPLTYEIVYGSTTISGLTGSSYKIKELTNGTSYSFSIYAVNTQGKSQRSSTVSAIPSTTPYAPTNVKASLLSTDLFSTVTLTFTEPSDNGGNEITKYNIYKNSYLSPDNLIPSIYVTLSSTGPKYTAIISNLTNNTNYKFIVQAANINGDDDRQQNSEISNVSNTIITALAPEKPEITNVTSTTTSVTVTFSEPISNGAPIINYTVIAYDTDNVIVKTKTQNVTEIIISDLTPNTQYKFTVSAKNDIGDSLPSSMYSYKTLPEAPVGLTGTYISPGLEKISWTNNSNNGSAQLTYSFSYLSTGASGINSTFYNVSNLTLGTDYTFNVVAVNSSGNSSPSSINLTIPSNPNKPSITNVSSTTTTATVTITPPVPNGAPIISYTVNAYDSNNNVKTNSQNATEITVSELVPNTEYGFQALATNDIGDSLPSSTYTYKTLPEAPTNISAVRTGISGEVDVSWTNSSNNGPLPLTYTLSYLTTGASGSYVGLIGSSYKVAGLVNSTEYTFVVYAVSARGQSESSSSVKETPVEIPLYSTPDPVTNITVTNITTTSASVSFTESNYSGTDTLQYTNDSTAITSSSFTLSNLIPNTDYSYTIKATNAGGLSGSKTYTFTTLPLPPTITQSGYGGSYGDQASFSWTNDGGNGPASFTYKITGTDGTNVTNYTANSILVYKSLMGETTYSIYVSNSQGDSVATITLKFFPPKGGKDGGK